MDKSEAALAEKLVEKVGAKIMADAPMMLRMMWGRLSPEDRMSFGRSAVRDFIDILGEVGLAIKEK